MCTHRPKVGVLNLDFSVPFSVVTLCTIVGSHFFSIHGQNIDAINDPSCFHIFFEFLEEISKAMHRDDFVNTI